MEDLKKWIGRKFLDFCKSDPDDEREIHYEMMTGDLSEKLEFTSREIVSMKTMEQIRKSIIRDEVLLLHRYGIFVYLVYGRNSDVYCYFSYASGRRYAH